MAKRKWTMTAVAALFVTVIGVAGAQAFGSPKVNHLTFSGTVALPGVTLPAGTYIFEVMVPAGSADVVRVSSREGRHYFLGLTRSVERPRGLAPTSAVTFGEVPAGNPPPVNVWYPIGGNRGHQFLYPAAR